MSTTKDVVAIERAAGERAAALHRDRTLGAEERRAALERLWQETNAQLSQRLGGQRGLEAYKLNGGGWLNRLRDTGGGGSRG